jgi:hypothetical protein
MTRDQITYIVFGTILGITGDRSGLLSKKPKGYDPAGLVPDLFWVGLALAFLFSCG